MYVCISVYVKVYSFIYFGKGGEGVKITHSVGLRQFLIKVTSFTPQIFLVKIKRCPNTSLDHESELSSAQKRSDYLPHK